MLEAASGRQSRTMGEAACCPRKRPLNGALLRFWGAERCVFSETRYEWGMARRCVPAETFYRYRLFRWSRSGVCEVLVTK